ncbi:MAG TPA: hypothetical protein DCY88_24645, partial [Cyanobacteria bacterium UBA11372]|nr:hypothetical protein [Cyanobacteria bacterium UBA11372]
MRVLSPKSVCFYIVLDGLGVFGLQVLSYHNNVLLQQRNKIINEHCEATMEEEQVYEVETLGRRNNPEYSQVTALVPKALAQRLRIFCVENEIQITEAVEVAIEEFLDRR